MSKIALSSNPEGTGVFTLASPNSNTDRTLNLPDSAGTIATAESTLAQFNASGSAPVYACRAWVNFNGTGTVAIRASGNVSSITDNGAGDYTVNFTTAMPDASYSAVLSTRYFGIVNPGGEDIRDISSSSVRVRIFDNSINAFDSDIVCVSIFR